MTPLALDITIFVIIMLSTMIAYFRGIIREFFTIAGVGLAVFASYMLGGALMPSTNKWLGVPAEGGTEKPQMVLNLMRADIAAKVAAYGGVFLIVFILMVVLRMLITNWINQSGLSVLDRLLGAAFGFVRGFLIVFAVYAVCSVLVTDEKFPDWAKKSTSVPILAKAKEFANKQGNFDKMVEDRGKDVIFKFNKIDPDKVGQSEPAKDEGGLKKDETTMDKPADSSSAVPAPTPAPAPAPQTNPEPAPAAVPSPSPAPTAVPEPAPAPAPAPTPDASAPPASPAPVPPPATPPGVPAH